MSARTRVPNLWNVRPRQPDAERELTAALGVPPLVAALLAGRGLADPIAARKFLHPKLEDLHDPVLLPDYAAASKAILGAVERKERIYIHGDYDVDGVTSAALLFRFLSRLGADVHVHVPHRMREGYGIHLDAVQDASEQGAKLFLTCDCGVAALEQVEAARAAGMAVVVTDHHEIGERLPNAQAVVNPHREDSHYPFEMLSGVGVAFKLCAGLTRDLGHPMEGYYRAFLDLAALGTVADVMPLVDENRVMVRHGLQRLQETKKPGLRALLDVAMNGKGEAIKAWHVGFRLGPRLNAAGRLDDAKLSLDLLLSNDVEEARGIAQRLDAINTERRAEQERIYAEAIGQITAEKLGDRYAMVVHGDGWHAGIIGIVAGRLAEQFHRPVFVMARDEEGRIGTGSARAGSTPFNLAEAIEANRDVLLKGGGHAAAAGFSMALEHVGIFADRVEKMARERLRPEDLRPALAIDAEVLPEEVDLAAAEALDLLEPFGQANPEPLLVSRGVVFEAVQPTSNPAHARVTLRAANGTIRWGIGFGMGERLGKVRSGSVGDVVFAPMIDTFNGNRSLKWQLKDFTLSD